MEAAVEYHLFADMLNKFSQLTPWVQAVALLCVSGMVISSAYFLKEALAALVKPFRKDRDA